MICAKCAAIFSQNKSWQRFCSERCRRNTARNAKRRKLAAESVRPAVECAHCATRIEAPERAQKYCSKLCRDQARYPKTKLRPARIRRLHCHRCGGPHSGGQCTAKRQPLRRETGTVGPGREYLPHPNHPVRHVFITTLTHSEKLTKILKELMP